MSKLIDLGEREILKSIIPKFAVGAGDDCACLDIPAGQLIMTTDPVPPPAAAVIGKDYDLFWVGWLLVTINVSDLAAAGATPLGFLAAIECEAERDTESFERLLEGVKAGCEEAGIAYVGGNLREASRVAAVGTAFGICDSYRPLTRVGAADADVILSIGQGGRFWRDATRLIRGDVVKKHESPVFRPISQIRIMHQLARKKLVKGAMDNSDGLLPSLNELSAKNHLGAVIDLEALTVPGSTGEETAESARFWLGWGDWNVLSFAAREHVAEIVDLCGRADVPVYEIGSFTKQHPDVTLRRGGNIARAPRLESERFAQDSWMLKGIDEYVRLMRGVSLP